MALSSALASLSIQERRLCQFHSPIASDEKKVVRNRMRWWTDLDGGKVEKSSPRRVGNCLQTRSRVKKLKRKLPTWKTTNKERMRYASFRAQGFFVGSSVVEAGCETIIGRRLKQSGVEWSVRGANAIISLRCTMISGLLEDYWESRCG